MRTVLKLSVPAFLLLSFFFIASCNQNAEAQLPKTLLGGWQGMTYGSGAYDPMFTMELNANGTWRDLTFGSAKAIKAKYTYNSKTKLLTLFTAKGSELYKMKLEPATASQKERLVEQRPSNESYKAMVCYRYTIK